MEVTDDKSLPKLERKRLQIATAPKKSRRAKLLKLADATSNVRTLAVDPPTDWDADRALDYIAWAEQVIGHCRDCNSKARRGIRCRGERRASADRRAGIRNDMIPGELFIKDGEIELNAGRKTVTLTVANTGDRPIQVGSHYHFFETNPALKFDRKKARGMRLDIAAGTAVRFEPGQTRDVQLVALAGKRVIYGFRGE